MAPRKAKEQAKEKIRQLALADEHAVAKGKERQKQVAKAYKQMLKQKDWDAEGILARRHLDENTDEVQVKWAGFHCKFATWEPVKVGAPHNYGPELGVKYGFVDEKGRKVGKDYGGILDEPKPQLARKRGWTEAVRESILAADIERAKIKDWEGADPKKWVEVVQQWHNDGYFEAGEFLIKFEIENPFDLHDEGEEDLDVFEVVTPKRRRTKKRKESVETPAPSMPILVTDED